jgi:hypothetical protein
MTGTVFPPADACTTSARRHFTIDLSDRPPPRLTIWVIWRPSTSDNRRTRNGCVIHKGKHVHAIKWWTRTHQRSWSKH